ncbi:hypothetical protein ACIQZN_26995 [Streptomyces sp. NPDC097595]|uniref:hypothetical protein n=1 Tax=Streptomyces sp. NPDC097595 TaxID=3366090 RepID=UPI003830966D
MTIKVYEVDRATGARKVLRETEQVVPVAEPIWSSAMAPCECPRCTNGIAS